MGNQHLPSPRSWNTSLATEIRSEPAERSVTLRQRRTFYARLAAIMGIRYFLLLIIAGLTSIPLFWMLSTSVKESGKEFLVPPEWVPIPIIWRNYIDLWEVTDLHLYGINSIMVALLATLGTVVTCSIVAFGFARIDFPGKTVLFFLLISTLMLPSIVTLVPTFVLFRVLSWNDTPMALIVPWWFGGGAFGAAFYVFLMRQFMLQLPRELDEAALADGASYFRIYWNILLPLSGPALATSAIFSIVHHWNDFLHPLIFLASDRWRTLALHLRYFLYDEAQQSPGEDRWNMLMASGVVMLIPILALFFSAQKYFVRGIALTGLAGR